MFGSRKVTRTPDRAWSRSLKSKSRGNGKPPGRPWHSNTSTKVCLLCLRQYNQREVESEPSDEEGDEWGCDNGLEGDPLSAGVTGLALDMMNSDKLTRGVEKTIQISRKRKSSLYVRFLTILGRHFRMNTKRFRNSALRNELAAPFCENCSKTVKQLCKVYEEWHNAKLGFQWRIRQISDAIKVSKVSVSGKLQCTLLKSLSTQLRVMSSQAVDIFRKQISIVCSAKLVNQVPTVSLNKNSCINAVKANWKWKFAFDQMKQYLQSLIVVFSLAVPSKVLPEKKCIVGPKSKTRRVWFEDGKHLNIKQEGGLGAEAKKENVPPRGALVKREPGLGGEDAGADDYHPADDDDDHFGGGDHSPPGSPGGRNEEEEDEGNKHDSDWSAGAASGNDSAGSDVEFSVNTNTVRRWNLRRRRTRSKSGGEGGDDGSDSDVDYVPGTLPPLRSARKKREIDESEKKFSCNLCSQKFAMERGLKRHLSQAHAFLMIYTCPKCPTLRFRRSKDLDAHRKKVHRFMGKPGDQLPYMGHPTACTVCDKMFPSKMKMMIHRKTTHKVMSTILTCELCGKNVRGQVRMEYHMKTHTRPDKSHRCTKCPRGFGTKEGLIAHLKLHEDNPDWVPWTRKKTKKTVTDGDTVFKCDIENCAKVFHKMSNLIIHKSLHSTKLKCGICEYTCSLTRDFRRHLNLKHETEEKLYFCLHCDKSFTLEQTYDLHKKIAHPTKATLVCDTEECAEQCETTEQLRQHIKTMHLPPDTEETKENVKFYDMYGRNANKKNTVPPPLTDPSQLASDVSTAVTEGTEVPSSTGNTSTDAVSAENRNMFEDLIVVNAESKDTGEILPDEPRLYTCARCDWSFSRKICYSLHLILHTPRNEKRTYACDLCDKEFSVVDSLQTHYNCQHGPKIKPYCCLICGVRFHRKESFIPHMRVHKDRGSDENFKCDICDKIFQDSINLHKHKRMAHQKEPYFKECDECKERFPNKLAVLTHKVDVHGMEKPYKCPAEGCGKGFFFQTQLTDHRICHTEPTFACHLCPKKFKRQHNLSDHILVHKQVKNHFCEYCGRSFVKKSSLNLHLDIHRGIKKYKCDYCGKTFCRKFARDCHLRVHTKEKPFGCELCGTTFAQYSALKMHLKIHEKYNSDKVIRRPFKKSVAVGKPLKTGKVKEDKNEEERVKNSEGVMDQPGTSASAEQGIENTSTPTTAGILHEAMKAAFDDIHMELEMGGVMKEEDAQQDQQQQSYSSGNGGSNAVQVINETSAVTAVAAVEQPLLEDGNNDGKEDEEEGKHVKNKRGRKPKTKKKSYSCGFCGKPFQREDFYNRHVERHMKEVETETAPSIGDSSQHSYQGSLMESHNSLQEVLEDEPHTLRRRSSTFDESVLNSPINIPTPPQQQQQVYQSPTPPVPTLSQAIEEQPRRRGRPPKNNGGAPGSRLARIVEDVLETAINRPGSVGARQQQQQHQQYPHQQPQQFHSPHHIQTPSPHHIVQSGSERSTPTGSPAPTLHHQQQQNSVTATTTATPTLPFPTSTAASILSPFLFSNPYLIPRMSDQQQQQQGLQQDGIFAGFQNRQTQQNAFPQHALQPQTSVSYPQQQFHQSSLPTSSQGSARTMPQDLSKNNYSLFYNTNQR